jgi:Zn-dependent peptidase ImmA (M78 family)
VKAMNLCESDMHYEHSIVGLLDSLVSKYKIKIQLVDRKDIKANCVVISVRDEHWLFLDGKLPENIKVFVLLHEIAHIKLGHLRHDVQNNNADVEMEANSYAIALLKPYISVEDHLNLSRCLRESEDLAYNYLRDNITFLGVSVA